MLKCNKHLDFKQLQNVYTELKQWEPFLYTTTFWNVQGGPLTVSETIVVLAF